MSITLRNQSVTVKLVEKPVMDKYLYTDDNEKTFFIDKIGIIHKDIYYVGNMTWCKDLGKHSVSCGIYPDLLIKEMR